MSYHGSNNTPQNPTPAAGQTQQQTSTPQTPGVGGVISTSLNFPTNPVRGDIITAGDNRWRYNGSVWNRIQPMVQGPEGPEGRQGATGATGATGPVEEFVASFNGATGAVEGVNSFNGITGAVSTTNLTLQVAGISASGGITIGGDIIDHTGTVGISGGLSITGDGNFNFVGDNFSITGDSSNSKFTVKVRDDISLIGGNTHDFIIDSDFNGTLTGQVKVRTDKGEFFRIASSSVGPSSVKFGDLDSLNSDTQINVSSSQTDGVTGNIFIETNGTIRETFNENYRRNTDVATFTIDASSAISTGAKINSLYRIPYNATLKNFDVKTNATGGLTAAIRIAGPDFGNPLTSGITGCSLGIEGLTGSSTVFNQASVTAGNFILLDIFSNNSGASAAQAFLTYETR